MHFSGIQCLHNVVQLPPRPFFVIPDTNFVPSYSPSLPPPPTLTSILHSVSVYLFTLGTSHKWNHVVCVLRFCLVSLSIKPSRFIHVVEYIKISILFKAKYYSIVCMCHIMVIQLSVKEHSTAPTFGYCE